MTTRRRRAACILVTPDAQRTMNTYLGAAQELAAADIDLAAVAGATIALSRRLSLGSAERRTHSDGHGGVAHGAGREVAFTLSDAFCVERYRDEFGG